jgi:hypothetical protein
MTKTSRSRPSVEGPAVIHPKESRDLKLGKGAAFDKCRLNYLRQRDESSETNIRALPTPIMQTATLYLGMFVSKRE